MKKGLLFQEYQDIYEEDTETTGADFLEVKMSRKIIEYSGDTSTTPKDGRTFSSTQASNGYQYEFTVTCLKLFNNNFYKVKRTYAQFLEFEEHIVELMD